jgi:hypothetical protein
MTTHRTLIPALLVAFAAGCDPRPATTSPGKGPVAAASTRPVSTTRPTNRAADRLEVFEAVFRHQFDKNASAGQRNVDYFFLALEGGADPPPEFLARFKDEKPIVLPASMATASAAAGVKHKDRGGRGLIFSVTSIAWLDGDTAEVEGGYYEGGLSASGNTYRVQRVDGAWKVTGDRMKWIS